MKLVLWPKYLLGGMLQREGGLGGLERGEGGSFAGGIQGLRGIATRLPDADVLLQGGMSEGLRDWDLWYVMVDSPGIGLSMLNSLNQGAACVLITIEPTSLIDSREEGHGLYRRVCSRLDRICCGNVADPAFGRQDVSPYERFMIWSNKLMDM